MNWRERELQREGERGDELERERERVELVVLIHTEIGKKIVWQDLDWLCFYAVNNYNCPRLIFGDIIFIC